MLTDDISICDVHGSHVVSDVHDAYCGVGDDGCSCGGDRILSAPSSSLLRE